MKNDLVRRFATVLGCLSLCFGAQADDAEETPEITVKEFSGASADLSSAVNWGGELPGPTDIAVIDVSKLGDSVTTLTLATDLSVAGLRVDNNDRNLVIAPALGASVKLTFGTCGFTNSVNVMDFQKGVGFKVPLVVSGAQTWNCGKQKLTTWSTISGSDLLTFVNAAFVIHDAAVDYGGKIYYNIPDISGSWQWSTSVRIYSGGHWADEIQVNGNCWLALTNETSWATLFTRRYAKMDGGKFGLCVRYTSDGNPSGYVGRLNFTDGDKVEGNSQNGAAHGYLNITGGEWNMSGEIDTGYFGYYYGTWYPYAYPGVMTISGGIVKGSGAFLGHYSQYAYSNYYHIAQSGGDVTLTTHLTVGGGNQGDNQSWGEYIMSGGTLKIASESTTGNNSLFPDIPLHIGGQFQDEKNLNCCNAYIAEVRAYPNRALTYNECLTVTKELLAKYDADPARLATVNANTGTRDGDVIITSGLSAAVPPEAAATESSWRADTLNDTLADGAEVTSWPNETKTVGSEATLALAGSKAQKGPTLVKNAMNGRSVLRFDAAEKTALAIPAAAAATSGATDFTAAVVFRSTKSGNGTGAYGTGASAGDGIIGSNQGTSKNDFAITWHCEGTAVGCWGTSSKCFIRKPFRLDDGLPHVAALTRDAAGGTYVWMVDGVPQPGTTTSVAALGSFDVLVGALAKEIDNGFFTGDIAAVKLWDKAMTREELKAASERLAWEYGFRLMSQFRHVLDSLTDRGLGATNVNVAAGATLKLPVSETAPLTLGKGRTFANAGTVEGTLALADGATLKVTAYGSAAATYDELRISGTVTVSFDDLPDLTKNRRLKLFTARKLTIAPGAQIVLDGLDSSSTLVIDEATGDVILRTRTGSTILLR